MFRRITPFAILAFVFVAQTVSAKEPLRPPRKKLLPSNQVNFRSACTTAQAQIDLDINNVRARLLTGGDMWWDRIAGAYVVPKPPPGQPGVSSIFAGAIWLGGFDQGGSLKVACQTYGNNGGGSDFWPGPLNADGETDPQTCNDWDRHFEVKGTEIKEHLNRWQQAFNGIKPYLESEIPGGVKGWPAKGNPYFGLIHGFALPTTDQGLAGFFDQDGDGSYEPLNGDFPIVDMRGCNNSPPQFPDQMIFWIYNDEGGGAVHGETNGIPIKMEIQATAFAYTTEDPINDMTFQYNKLINRAKEDIDSTYFALWLDGDLGCHLDDYVGCDPSRNLAYYYNMDAVDGQPGYTCDGVATYGNNIPALGIDIFRGPLNEYGLELGMSSFIYFGNSLWGGPPGMSDPSTDVEFYRYLSHSWKDGSPLTYGGDGYDPGNPNAILTHFAFPSPPNDPNGWSMCHPGSEFPVGLPANDVSTVQSSGPFTLQPGAVNELIFGVIFAPNIDYPCPDLSRLFAADDYVQSWLFDNCILYLDGPDAPDVDWIAGDRQITGILTNPNWSNNLNEAFEETVFGHPKGVSDSTYNFEGYLVYQLAGPSIIYLDEINDTTKARLVFQSDMENGVINVTNWKAERNPNYQLSPGIEEFIYWPASSIQGKNGGIQHEFTITEDLFAKGNDRRLVNHRNYYYIALAYAVNNFQPFNTTNGMGQKTMYVIGRSNIGPNGDGSPYIVLPRPAQGGLDKVQIVPNPFYNFSAYADSEGNGVLKITNLPAKCEVSIFTLDGRMVRHFSRNEVPAPPYGSGVVEQQIYPDLIWDLQNSYGKTVASGIYLVRIQAEGFGEITLKAVVI